MGVTSVGHRILMLRRFSDIIAGRISVPPRPARLLSDPPAKEGDARAAEPRRVTTAIESSDSSASGSDRPLARAGLASMRQSIRGSGGGTRPPAA
jgi:hypothetical protein